ncbi:magnesium-translocating P-type ATPase [Eubacterium limosum]|uniref:magnesium-translocating P-type ATPase n=1 Tax=Eubacterium limosum TaxID=1736 RepID=UPI00106265A2|nr:magnesium-translocating P-type ATPase [Eubacterium limosum]
MKMILNNVKDRLLEAAVTEQNALVKAYGAGSYNEEKAAEMREAFGENKLSRHQNDSVLKRIFEAFVNPFTVILIVLALVSFVTDVMLAAPEEKDPVFVMIVGVMVLISGSLRFFQEQKSDRAAERLGEMVETTAAVDRSPAGKAEIPLDEIVVGDTIYLAAGDMVPADVRILNARDLFISQSSLTGESEAVEKYGNPVENAENDPLSCNNLAFMGTNVVSGSAKALVLAVGDDTIFGSLASQLSPKRQDTSFDKGVNSVSWVLIRFMLVMVPLVFLANGLTKGDWPEAFLFAISVAVGLTPEMLPMIVSANLAKSAVAMSKKKVIVKNLSAIQNFGAMDVLCTDKTGTLTQDKVVLEYPLDIHGNEDDRVMRHAFLNSWHQTGLKNLMDQAVINHVDLGTAAVLKEEYRKVDEIPFDFNRRRMSVVVADGTGKTQMITKGAIEEMLSVCSYAEYKGKVEPITEEVRNEILEQVRRYNDAGMRVLGVAQKTNPAPVGVFSVADESDMVLIGYLAFLDPPKESTEAALKVLKEYGVGVKVLTGDNEVVTKAICRQVGMPAREILLGSDIEKMEDNALKKAVERTDIFAKLSPLQKVRIVEALKNNGHTTGFLGDGINDAGAMKAADVGISVDTAVDIARESADIILLEKDLMVLEEGVVEGRKTYANIIKYIKMTASSNFGNMFSVLAASIFLPMLPMLPMQLLVLNLIYDISCTAIPWDNVDPEYLKMPRKWDASSIVKFMLWMGPASSVFDITTYLFLFFYICPMVFGGAFHTLGQTAQIGFIALFHAGWFVESLWTQTLVIHMIRSPKLPFIGSHASWQLTGLTTLGIAVGTILPFTFIGAALDMVPLPGMYFPFLIVTVLLYMALVTMLKKIFVRRYGELL